ncbi:endonuclease NucS [Candidatus Woesearchaeota archaeon]|nr:endonuclease NucS [Candidatus Woesearchaeota archaeon]
MTKKPIEKIIQSYLIKNQGQELKKIDKTLTLLEEEYKITGGRIDILCHKKNWRKTTPIGIELKALNYNTSYAIGQLTKYINFMEPKNGQIYFLAPMIKKQIYDQLKPYYKKQQLHFYEYQIKPGQGFRFEKINPKKLNDNRPIKWMDEVLKEELWLQGIRKKLNIKNSKNIRAAFEIVKFFEKTDINQINKKNVSKLGSSILSHYDNNKKIKYLAKMLDIYAKI